MRNLVIWIFIAAFVLSASFICLTVRTIIPLLSVKLVAIRLHLLLYGASLKGPLR